MILKTNMASLSILAAMLIMMSNGIASAQDLSPVSNMLASVEAALTGPIGKSIAVIAVIGVGFACLLGRLNWTLFGMVLVGCVLIFFAGDIIDGFTG